MRRYSAEEDAAIRLLWAQQDIEQIARQVGRSRNSIWQRANRLKLPRKRRPFTAQEQRRVKRLIDRSYTHAEIAKLMGRSIHSINDLARKKRIGKIIRKRKPFVQKLNAWTWPWERRASSGRGNQLVRA